MEYETCEGCQSMCKTEDNKYATFTTKDNGAITCPCSICIVKVTCKSMCETFANFVINRDRNTSYRFGNKSGTTYLPSRLVKEKDGKTTEVIYIGRTRTSKLLRTGEGEWIKDD